MLVYVYWLPLLKYLAFRVRNIYHACIGTKWFLMKCSHNKLVNTRLVLDC